MPAALNVDWDEIRRAAELGASFDVLSSRYGVAVGTIAKRAERQKWLVPSQIAKRMIQQKQVGDLIRRQGTDALHTIIYSGSGNEAGKVYADKRSDGAKVSGGVEVARPKPAFSSLAELHKSLADSDSDSRERVESIVNESWEQRGAHANEFTWAVYRKSVEGLDKRGLMITDVKDFKTITALAREATGQFKTDSPAISLSIFQNGEGDGYLDNQPAYEAECSVVPANSDDWL